MEKEELIKLSHDFYALFKGNDRSVGRWNPKTGKTFTEDSPPAPEHFAEHLTGKLGVGVVPITDDHDCSWGAIDIDNHGQDEDIPIAPVEAKARQLKLPLVICRSKSGGIHAYVFFKKPTSAVRVRGLLTEWAKHLGFEGAEIFPKQATLRKNGESRQLGNWINLPYHAADLTNRYAYHVDRKLTTVEFVELATKMRVEESELKSLAILDHAQAPPCVQQMLIDGVTEGSRNEAAFHIGIYLRKSYPEEQEKRLRAINQTIFPTPLPRSELQRTITSSARPDYRYRCNIDPQKSLCNREVCLTRTYGITADEMEEQDAMGAIPMFSDLAKFMTEPIRWEMKVDNVTVTNIATSDLLEWRFIRQMITEKLNKIVPMIKNQEWERMLAKLMETLRVVDAPDDASINGMVRARLREFAQKTDLLNMGENTDDRLAILRGLPAVVKYDGIRCVFFRQMDFVSYLKRTRSESINGVNMWFAVKQIGVFNVKMRVGKDNINVWGIPVEEVLKDAIDVGPQKFESEL